MIDPTPAPAHRVPYPENVQRYLTHLQNKIIKIDDRTGKLAYEGEVNPVKTAILKSIKEIEDAYKFIYEQDISSNDPEILRGLYNNINNIMKNLEDEIYGVRFILKNIETFKKEAVKSQNIIDASPDDRHTEYIKRTIKDKETYIKWVHVQIDRLQECKH